MPTLATVLRDAKSLPKKQRMKLIEKLTETIVQPLSKETVDELFQRLEDVDSGKVQLIDGETARANIRKALELA
jgi:hypothetical protein